MAASGIIRLEDESRHRNFKPVAVHRHKKIMPAHESHRRSERGAAGVLKSLTRLKQRLLPHHTQAVDHLRVAMGILDLPVARHQLGRDITGVADGDGVGKHIQRPTRV